MADNDRPEPLFVKVAECLYRNRSSGTYFALVKRKSKQIRKSLKTKDRKLAERRLRDFRAKAGLLTASSAERKVSFGELASRWLEIHNASLKTSSAERNKLCVKNLNRSFGSHSISDISPASCENWMAKRSPDAAASTFNKEAEVLKQIFEYARANGLILDNPASNLKRRRIVEQKVVVPTRDEYAKLLEALEAAGSRGVESTRLVQLLALSGMRLGEATRITWREVNFKRSQFTVSGGEVGTKNNRIRVVPLFPKLHQFLEELQTLTSPVSEDRLVKIASAKSAMETACRKANLQPFSHHSLRHYFVSNAIEVGIDFKTISDWIGHRDGGMLVAKTYGHLRQEHSLQMAQRMV